MFHRDLIAAFLLVCTTLLPPSIAIADEDSTTVALTVSVYDEAGPEERELVESLLVLLESEVSMHGGLHLVERRQVDLALQELALSADLGQDTATRLQLGKMVSANLIVTLELLKPEKGDETLRVLIRIVEPLTGAIRGVSVAQVTEARLDEAAVQVARYLASVDAEPERSPITVAVAPFESQGRFDRLRPLEQGIRDVIATRLARWSDTIAKEQARQEAGQAQYRASGFLVLQRSGMQELLRELEMIQSAVMDPSRLPMNLPTRAAAFLVRGEIDENNAGGAYRVIVSGQLVHAASNAVVRDFKFEAQPAELEAALAQQVDLLAGHLLTSQDTNKAVRPVLLGLHEVDSLFRRSVADLHRFRRRRPTDFSYRDFELPVDRTGVGPAIVPADSPLGRAILEKSINRLEAALFIQPDRGDIAYALGFCYSFHIRGIWNADRTDELLRRAAGSDADGPLQTASLRLLAEVSFHHESGEIPSGHQKRAVDQLLYAFQYMPSGHRDVIWASLPSTMSAILPSLRDTATTMRAIKFAAAEAEREESPFRYQLATGVSALSIGTVARRDSANSPDAMGVLKRWASGEQVTLKQVAARALAQMALNQQNHAEAAQWYLAGADALAESASRSDQYARDNLRINAARCLRQAGQLRRALGLLQSFVPTRPDSLNAGYHAVELGECYIEANQHGEALAALITAAEQVPNLRDNSPVEQLINQLGGVPLREDRDVDVEYVAGLNGKPLISRVLATDGSTLFCAGGFLGGVPRGVLALNPRHRTWQSLTTRFGRVTSMAVHQGQLWVGTAEEGVWVCALSSNHWTHWSSKGGLPDDRVTILAPHRSGAFVGLGSPSSGGVVFIDANGRVTVLDGQGAPATAPSYLVAQEDRLLAATRTGVHEYALESQQWRTVDSSSGLHAASIFAGQSHPWVSRYRRELAPYDVDDDTAKPFSAAWFDEPNRKAGYRVHFVIEHNGQIWFGGDPWQRFRSVGFYRVDPATGEFHMYGMRDGFHMSATYSTYAGVAINNDLWIATSAGLARVTPR